MKDAMGIIIGVVLTVVALTYVVTGTFVPFKSNQEILTQTNTNLMSTLQAEIGSSTDGTVTQKGSAIKSLINSSVGGSNVKIYVNGTLWDGKAYGSSNVSVSDDGDYTRTISNEGGTMVYRFESK